MRARSRMSGFVLTAPKTVTWWVAVIVGALGIILNYQVISIAALSPWSFLMVAGAFVLLALGCALRGL